MLEPMGVIDGLSNDDYHAAHGISKSGLDLVGRSLAHYWERYRNPDRIEKPKSAVFKAGAALHTLILEPETFNDRYAVLPDDAPARPTDAMLNAAKNSESSLARINYWAHFDTIAAGREVIDGEDYDTWARAAQNIHNHPTIRELIDGGARAETSVFTTDPETGVVVKFRPDWWPKKHKVFIDVKSAEDAGTDAFARAAMNYGYREASALYIDAAEWAGIEKPEAMFFVAFEKEAPYGVQVFEPTERFVQRGRDNYRRNLNKYAAALKAGPQAFIGYPKEVQALDLMGWER